MPDEKKGIKSTKSGDWRTIPMSSDLEAILKDLYLKTGHTPFVFPRLRDWTLGLQAQALRAFCTEIGIPSVKFHTLRACFATQLLQKGVPSVTIQKICGWKDLKTMQRYIRLAGIETDGATEVLTQVSQNKPRLMHSDE